MSRKNWSWVHVSCATVVVVFVVLFVSTVSTLLAAEPAESHLTNIRQLTTGGKSAEAYFSSDGDKLIFQSTRDSSAHLQQDCYQMYVMDLDGKNIQRVSNGFGTTTCGYFFPGRRRILFSSTHRKDLACPPKLTQGAHYRWALHDFDIFSYRIDGREPYRLTTTPGYDAEATVSFKNKKIIFTSMRDGDLDLYTMDLNGTRVIRLTDDIGYDGGAFFSPDEKRIVYRAFHPTDPVARQQYQDLLKNNLVEPSHLEIFIMNADGSEKRQITKNGAANFAPSFHHDGRRIIFSSNVSHHVEKRSGPPSFHLYLMNDDGTGMEQITHDGHFNSFPMFSPDGTRLVWVSDRQAQPGEFNVFLADWVP
ncbi:MAG: hypothetical protein GKS05_04990 [Nitrospirales bacterium]|nr:hypothetical protein [Nitrospirales bacterium]